MSNGKWAPLPIGYASSHPRIQSRLFWSADRGAVLVGAGPDAMFGVTLDPDLSTWRSAAAAPIAWRDLYAAVWTGTEVIVWGGANTDGETADGAIYDPTTNQWSVIAPSPLSPRASATAVWCDGVMVVFGGATAAGELFADAAIYSPASDEWQPTAPLHLAPRFSARAVWTGEELLTWGGTLSASYAADGAAFDLGSERWQTLPEAPIEARTDHSAVWSGDELLVWGGSRWVPGDTECSDGAAFDPRSGSWRVVAEAPLGGRHQHACVWTGDHMVVWGGADSPSGGAPPSMRADGAIYDPRSDTWALLDEGPLAPRFSLDAVWTGAEAVLWGGCCTTPVGEAFSDGAALRLA